MADQRPSMARPGRCRQGRTHPRNRRQNNVRDRLLFAQLLSAPLTPERFNEVVRVENRLHWRLDVVMNEDQDRSRLGNGPHNHAVLRHMAMNVMQKDGEKGSLRGKIKRAGWDEAYLARLLSLF